MKRVVLLMALSMAFPFAVGCGDSKPKTPSTSTPTGDFLTSTEPSGAKSVGDVLKAAKDSDSVTVEGRIGGSDRPFVEGLAAFTIVDKKIPYCADSEGCPTPWDYCCQTDNLKGNQTLVKLVDAAGKPVAKGAKELLGVKELSMVVVEGKAQRDADGNMTVLATKVFVRK